MPVSYIAVRPLRFARLFRHLCAGVFVLTSLGCEAPTEPPRIPLGHYELARVSGTSLAEARICGVQQVLESSLILGPGNAATLTYRADYGDLTQSFVATGAFREVDGRVRVSVRGWWTYTPAVHEQHRAQLLYEFEIVGSELHRFDGMACDARESLEYVFHAPF